VFGNLPIPYPKREFISDDDAEDKQAGAAAAGPGVGGEKNIGQPNVQAANRVPAAQQQQQQQQQQQTGQPQHSGMHHTSAHQSQQRNAAGGTGGGTSLQQQTQQQSSHGQGGTSNPHLRQIQVCGCCVTNMNTLRVPQFVRTSYRVDQLGYEQHSSKHKTTKWVFSLTEIVTSHPIRNVFFSQKNPSQYNLLSSHLTNLIDIQRFTVLAARHDRF
ncbi:unnamed protein product, partial [Echinostoma caproni]|uniref:Myotubularin phosphatase domain-containing protein n=1 Tax=Echinostoma caproni TaxID=27848 RepID=A0A183BGK1_9TREM